MTDKDILERAKKLEKLLEGHIGVHSRGILKDIIQEVEKLRDNERITSEANEMLRGKFMEYLRQIDSLTKERDELRGLQKSLLSQKLGLEAKLEESQDELKEFKLAHEYCHLHGDEL